jgi:pyruvate,water dikinase
MKWIIPASQVKSTDRSQVGGKGFALARMAGGGFNVPPTLCVTSSAYDEYVTRTGLRERILLELHRKDFTEMRWEEIWDCATRIRNMFLTKPMPSEIEAPLKKAIHSQFKGKSVVVRSSAPEEDDASASFAGLHESYLNVRGIAAILEHIRKVWASLWSDAALLYRQEIGLDIHKSAMAVVVQEIVVGDRSGVAFTCNPNNDAQGIIESVYGLNQGLVDGAIEPDRWVLDRQQRSILNHTAVERKSWMIPFENSIQLAPLPAELAQKPPLVAQEAISVFDMAMQSEDYFGAPQDVEWTFKNEKLYLLQSRPITTLGSDKSDDRRSWYLSLHRSFENLKQLRSRIEDELIPAMIEIADQLAAVGLKVLTDTQLAQEIRNRWQINHKWVNTYWEEFIPFAHGVRLFGQFYNDIMHPEDPYEFIDLLTHTDMASLARNEMLEEMAERVRSDSQLAKKLSSGDLMDVEKSFLSDVEAFIEKFGDLSCTMTGGTQCLEDSQPLIKILLQMAAHPPATAGKRKSQRAGELKERFLRSVEEENRDQAKELLDLARASYRLRDDDNIYLGRIEARLLEALQEARQRIEAERRSQAKDREEEADADYQELKEVLEDLDPRLKTQMSTDSKPKPSFEVKPRQLIGQPAGPGLARGKARVVQQHADLSDFRHGDVLVCDAVDPNMTFVIPLAAAVVERRGGMLIHGAIIAREYGLPCVTGIPDATSLIETGDQITVDGYLGIVTVGTEEL